MMKRVAAEGMIAGTIGATVVAGWFLLYDMAHGRPFRQQEFFGAISTAIVVSPDPSFAVREEALSCQDSGVCFSNAGRGEFL
jgi:hypothetical protein